MRGKVFLICFLGELSIQRRHFKALSANPPCFAASTAGDIKGAVQTLRSLLLFYPSDRDSLDNLQLYSETLGGDTESQGTQPAQVAPKSPLWL